MKYKIKTESFRDANLTDFSKATLDDRYLHINPETSKKETSQQCFERISTYYADDQEHAQRLYDYISQLWFMPSTPILSNGGTERGLPISCFLNETEDNIKGIVDMWTENVWLASKGGGIGSYWGNLRSIGEKVKGSGKTSGIIPFIVVQNALTLAISQGSLRRGSTAVYLSISHPEIEEFLDIRKPIGGDPNRKALNLHHGVVITDKFMEAVVDNDDWHLISPKDEKIVTTVKARELWIKILNTRVETGEPYIIFIDNVNKNRPDIYKKLGLEVKMSNLCAEITLSTGIDYNNKKRTAVCCLSSLNLEKYESWKNNPIIVEDIMRFLDNVLEDFIQKAPASMANAVYSAKQERSVGLGVMGFHSLLQNKMIPFGSPMAKDLNLKIFKKIREQANAASILLTKELFIGDKDAFKEQYGWRPTYKRASCKDIDNYYELKCVAADYVTDKDREELPSNFSKFKEVSCGALDDWLENEGIDMSVEEFIRNENEFNIITGEIEIAKAIYGKARQYFTSIQNKSRERFTHKLAIAPTASISIIAGSVSPGIDPHTANIYSHNTITGSFVVRNKALKELLNSKGKDNENTWTEIINFEGSVQHLDFLNDVEKEVFKTSSEIDQNWVIELAADRQQYICQSQSLNLFLNPNISKKELHKLHLSAWEKGIKSLYYVRTKSLARTDKIGIEKDIEISTEEFNYDDAGCLACQ